MANKKYDQKDEASLEKMYKNQDHHSELFGMCEAIDENTVHWELPTYRHHCWVDVDNLSICIQRTDEGAVVDIFENKEKDADLLATTYAFFQDADRRVE